MTRTSTGRAARSLRRAVVSLVAASALAVTLIAPVGASGGSAPAAPPASVPLPAAATKHACGTPAKGHLRCYALERTDLTAHSARAAALNPAVVAGYTPQDLQAAYAVASAAATSGAGVTVAVVDAYDDPTAERDLGIYRAQFGLPPCTTANGCFRKVNQAGGSSMPAADAGWSAEISLDLDMVSAICPRCSILLVEANSTTVDDLGSAVNEAVALGAKYVSNSYGGPEDTWSTLADAAYFNHAGVVLTASTGDAGYEVQYPASSPDVVAVGGTTLTPAAGARGWAETAWDGGGSGCSVYETSKPSWQTDSGCPSRMVADVSAVADPATGVAVMYNGYWNVYGGTSAAAPIVAAVYALAGAPAAGSRPGAYPYLRGGLNDVTSGTNGPCSPDPSYWCTAGAGYDGPTGIGTPNDVDGFVAPGLPTRPTGVVATSGDGSAAVAWTAPASSGSSSISSSTVTAMPGGRTCTAPGASTACTVTGLANGTAYTFTVRAANAQGLGPWAHPSSPVTPIGPPGAPSIVSVAGGTSQVQVAWTAPASDGGTTITSYTATASPGGASCGWTAGPLTCTITGLSDGSPYTITVTAANAAGTGPASAPSATVVPGRLPSGPTSVTAVPAPPVYGALSVTWAPPADPGTNPITAYTATASTGQACTAGGAPPATGCTITGLTPGVAVVVTVTATSLVGTGPASDPSAPVTPPSAPAASLGALPVWSPVSGVAVAWSGSPGTNPVASFDVKVRRAAWNGGFGAASTWQSATVLTGARLGVAPGSTYCLSVRARDTMGFTSAWSPERCTAVPLDDRSLVRYGWWGAGTGSAYYRGTYIRSTAYGARAVRASVQARRIAIVATVCPTCGSVRVYWGSTLIKTVSLYSRTTVNRRVITVATFSGVRSGTVTVKLSTSGRRVLLDGLAISRV